MALGKIANVITSLIIYNVIGIFVIFFGATFAETKLITKKNSKVTILGFSIIFTILSVFFLNVFYVFISLSNHLSYLCVFMLVTYTEEIYPTIIKDHAMGFMNFINGISGVFTQFVFLTLYKIDIAHPLFLYILFIVIFIMILIYLPDDNENNLDSSFFGEEDEIRTDDEKIEKSDGSNKIK